MRALSAVLTLLLLVRFGDAGGVPHHPSKCCSDPHERYTECGPACGGDGCTPIQYFAPCNQTCAAGCFCECGYFRDFEGKCVLPSLCPRGTASNIEYSKVCPGHQCCGRYEVFGQSNACFDRCWPNGPDDPVVDCYFEVQPGCFCLPGYKRNPTTGECVPLDECPGSTITPVCRRVNEQYTTCGSACQTCQHAVSGYLGHPQVCTLQCLVGCHCADGYYRDRRGNCVNMKECLAQVGITNPNPDSSCNRPNEHYTDCGSRCSSCFHVVSEAQGNPLLCPAVCERGCFCQNGFWRDNNGHCVTGNQCLAQAGLPTTTAKPDVDPSCTGPHKLITDCGSSCQTCASVVANAQGNGFACPAVCISGCFCESGFYMDGNGHCVTSDECLDQAGLGQSGQCAGPHEQFNDCGSACQSCSDAVAAHQGRPQVCITLCVTGCQCDSGYWRDSNGNCVTTQECLEQAGIVPTTCSKPFEQYDACGSHCQTCTHIIAEAAGTPENCLAVCAPGCHCQPGYWRDENSNCVPAAQCFIQEGQCKRPFEQYNACGSGCQTCSFLLAQSSSNPQFCLDVCVPGCHCQAGHYRDDITGLCVPAAQCYGLSTPKPLDPRCNRPNQVYTDCGSSCQTCSTVVAEAMGRPVACTDQCLIGCHCERGFYSDRLGNCVNAGQCLAQVGLTGTPRPIK